MIFVIILLKTEIVGARTVEPHRDGSDEYPQSLVWSKNKKIGIPLHTKVFIYKSGV